MKLRDYCKKTQKVIREQPGWYPGAEIVLATTKEGGVRLYTWTGREWMDASLHDIPPDRIGYEDEIWVPGR